MDEQLWTAILTCADCGAVLNTAAHVPESKKAQVAFSSALAAGPCPKGCRSTFSDMNLNTKLEWQEEEQPRDGVPSLEWEKEHCR